jgi:hypothetical protein
MGVAKRTIQFIVWLLLIGNADRFGYGRDFPPGSAGDNTAREILAFDTNSVRRPRSTPAGMPRPERRCARNMSGKNLPKVSF